MLQLSLLSIGRDFIMVTHICLTESDPVDVCQAQEIVGTLTLAEESTPLFWSDM
jgi:hypothetical protein